MAIAIILLLIAAGSVAFHLLSPWWWTPIASNWNYIDATLIITFWITGLVFTSVVLFVAYCVFTFRHRQGARPAFMPENKRLEFWLAVGTGLGIAAMLAPGLLVWSRFVRPPDDAAVVEVVGQQWQWSFRLPGQGGRLGLSDTRFVGPDNPLGLNPNDPNSRDNIVIVGNDLHLPVGRPVKLLLRSLDVVHDFYVPEFRAKMDLVPGMVSYVWFTPTRTGTYDLLCFGLCGVGHASMRGKVVVDDAAAYQAWLQQQQTFGQQAAHAARDAAPALHLGADQREAAR